MLVLLPSAVLALIAPAFAGAINSPERVDGSESIELRYGQGYAVLDSRGAALGRVRRGWIRVINLPGDGPPLGYVRGCESRSGRLATRLLCRGWGLRFFIHDGTWRIRIGGRGINVSGVVRGSLGLDRAPGCPQTACKYRIGGDSSFSSWPHDLRYFNVRS